MFCFFLLEDVTTLTVLNLWASRILFQYIVLLLFCHIIAVEVGGRCSHGYPSAGRDVCNGESTFSVDVKGCEQSIPTSGRGTDGQCNEFPTAISLRALLRLRRAIANSCALITACLSLSEVSWKRSF